ncbi:MAG: type restriction enzyme protein [Acidobacteriota bacterium]|jgi:type I restriction enzyme M protein|nr:type restriction enzyme protein [Acidobacteriota bacterium]
MPRSRPGPGGERLRETDVHEAGLAVSERPQVDDDAEDVVGDGYLLDFISGSGRLKDTSKEQVRQRIARALFHEYGISVDDMAADFPIRVAGRRRNVDIAIFSHGKPHEARYLRRVVVCRPEPKQSKRGAVKMRDYDQAAKDIDEIKPFFEELEACEYGLWTNGLEFFFVRKKATKFQVDADPIGDWPPGDESLGTRDVVSHAKARRADPEMLRTAFRRCHNFIHGNEGMPKDAAFWQFLYLIFCKMYDERAPRSRRLFWAGPQEQFSESGRKAIQNRIAPLFDEVKKEYKSIFRGNEEITLSSRALAFMVSELSKYEFTRIDVDAKGAAYQEIVGTNLRGDRGQYFTPRGAIRLVVEILQPKENERVLDPACGTGGFLVATLAHMMKQFRAEAQVRAETESSEEFESLHERLRRFASNQVFGCDFDPFLIRASQMNMVMAGDGKGHLYHLNSLEFPDGHLSGVKAAQRHLPLGSVEVVMTNPPFGSEIPITDESILKHYDLAHVWERLDDGSFRNTGRLQGSVAPEVIFIERCLNWLKPRGRMGIVLPDGILGNPAAEYIRWWILRHAWVLASVDLPVETFIVEANVNILTSLLFLKKKPDQLVRREAMSGPSEYPVFMAVAEKVGFDRRGNKLYKRSPEGEELTRDVEEIETITVAGRKVARTLRRKSKIIDDDLPVIAERYRAFRREHPEPGT